MSDFAPNVGRLDAAARLILGPILVLSGFWLQTQLPPGYMLGMIVFLAIVGVYLILTGAVRNDVFYHILGWDTRREAREERRAQTMTRRGLPP